MLVVDDRLIQSIRRPDGRLSPNIQANIFKAVTKLQAEASVLRANGEASFSVFYEEVVDGSFAVVIVVRARWYY